MMKRKSIAGLLMLSFLWAMVLPFGHIQAGEPSQNTPTTETAATSTAEPAKEKIPVWLESGINPGNPVKETMNPLLPEAERELKGDMAIYTIYFRPVMFSTVAEITIDQKEKIPAVPLENKLHAFTFKLPATQETAALTYKVPVMGVMTRTIHFNIGMVDSDTASETAPPSEKEKEQPQGHGASTADAPQDNDNLKEEIPVWLESGMKPGTVSSMNPLYPMADQVFQGENVQYTIYLKPINMGAASIRPEAILVNDEAARLLENIKKNDEYDMAYRFVAPAAQKTVRLIFKVSGMGNMPEVTLHLNETAPNDEAGAELQKQMDIANAHLKDGMPYAEATVNKLKEALKQGAEALAGPVEKKGAAIDALMQAIINLRIDPIDAWIENASGNGKPSAANQYMRPLMDAMVEQGKIVYNIYFKTGDFNGTPVKVTALEVDDKAATLVPGKNVHGYDTTYRFERSNPKERTIKIKVTDTISGTHEAILHLNEKAPNVQPTGPADKLKAELDKAAQLLKQANQAPADAREKLKKAIAQGEAALKGHDPAQQGMAIKALQEAMAGLKGHSPGGDQPGRIEKTVDAYLKHTVNNKKSMADDAFYHRVDMIEENGQVTYKLYFKDLPVKLDGRPEVNGVVERIDVDGVEADRISGYNSTYDKGFKFTRSSNDHSQIRLTFHIQGMPATQDAYLILGDNGSGLSGSNIGETNKDDKNLTDEQKALKAAKKTLDDLIKQGEKALKDNKTMSKEAYNELEYRIKDGKAVGKLNQIQSIEKAIDKLKAALKAAGEKPLVQPEKKEEAQSMNGYIAGYPDGMFRPDQQITRGETAALLARLLKADGNTAYPTDVERTAWYAGAVAGLVNKGILSADRDYRPNDVISRAEMAALLARAKGWHSQPARFSDVVVNHWAIQVIGAGQAQGILAGYPNGTFGPERSMTRAEMVVMLNRSFRVAEPSKISHTFSDVPVEHWAAADIIKAAN